MMPATWVPCEPTGPSSYGFASFSPVKSQPPMASDDLRRQADAFIDLADLSEIIGRPSRLPRFIQESRMTNESENEADAEA